MSSQISPPAIGIDLLQDSFHISEDVEGHRRLFDSQLLPTALLPLYPGEKGIFASDALNHRRAKGWQRPNECRMFWNNDSQKGCGRVILAAAMQRLVNYHLSWGEQKGTAVDNFSWQPLRNKQMLGADEIVIGSLQGFLKNTKSLIALPLPDSSTQGVQQALINAFNNRGCAASCCGSTLFLLKRSIAQAMLWCKKHQESVAKKCVPSDKQHAGHLFIINVNMDCWEARLVPLRWHLWEEKFYLVPVDSAYWPRESLQVSGWQLVTNRLNAEGIVGESLWQSLVGQELLQDLFNQPMTPQCWEWIRQQKTICLPHTSDLCAQQIPDLAQIEQALQRLQNRQHELRSENSSTLGVIVDGCCAHWFMQLNLLSELELDSLKDAVTIAHSGSPSLAAQGAQLYAKYQSAGLPTYHEELIPICIWCRNSSRYGQEFIWKALISNSTIPAGSYSQLENCPGFILPAGQNELQLILRRPSIDQQEEYEYRKIPAQIYEKFNSNINVTIAVEIKPGSGHAKASLLSDDGHLLSELNWKAMAKCEKPSEHQPAYLARTCEALCEGQSWLSVAKELGKLNLQEILKKKHALHRFEEPLNAINELFIKSRVKPDKNNCYLELRVISSQGSVVSSDEQLKLLSQFLGSCYLLTDLQNEKELKKRVLQAMRHLFTAISSSSRQFFLKKLDFPHEITMQELLCIGQSFCEPMEIAKFFETFLVIDHKEIFYWLRALRAILRYRYEAFDPEIINNTLYEGVWGNIVNKLLIYADRTKILRSALQCLIYMLGRRRFDKNFVGLKTKLNEDLNEAVKYLQSKKLHLDILDQLEKLLNCNATEKDIGSLLASEVSNDI